MRYFKVMIQEEDGNEYEEEFQMDDNATENDIEDEALSMTPPEDCTYEVVETDLHGFPL